MTADAKVKEYESARLGYLPILALTVRHTAPPAGSQSLSLELMKDGQIVSLTFAGLRQLRLADIGPGSHCLLNILPVAKDQMEGIRYRVFNGEQDLTLAFYCADFEFSAPVPLSA